MKKIILLFVLFYNCVQAQKKDENIGTEVVNVVKPYSPSVSDAFKIKEIPVVTDSIIIDKIPVNYKIFSFPVASTFTPSKGKSAGVEKDKPEPIFTNYALVGLGNYGNVVGDLFISHPLDNYQNVGFQVNHFSSQGGIKKAILSDKFSSTQAKGFYNYQRKEVQFKASLAFKTEAFNWFGVPIDKELFYKPLLNSIHPKHKFNTIELNSHVVFENSFFNSGKFQFIRFWDNFNSSENRFVVQPNFTFDIGNSKIKTNFNLDYLNTSFEKAFQNSLLTSNKVFNNQFSNLIFGVNPNYTFNTDNLSINLGVEVVFLSRITQTINGIKNSESNNDFYLFPKIDASYNLVNSILTAFGGAQGGLIQNSYANFANQNKQISPTLVLEPSNQKFDVFAGLRGKLSTTLSYNSKVGFISTQNKAFFKTNPYLLTPTANYAFGNSFEVVYDNLNTLYFFGELKADVNKNISLNLQAQVNKFKTSTFEEAWNLPVLEVSFTSDFSITKKWFAGAQIFYTGERKDQFLPIGFINQLPKTINLDAFLDINLNVTYKYNKQLSAFLKGNNLANQSYNNWLNYPVQGAQVLLGANYKFEF